MKNSPLHTFPAMSLLAGVFGLGVCSDSYAVSTFARQTGMDCASCHFQTFPALSAFGRSFKAEGYTLMGTQETVKGDNLSLPVVLNVGLVAKLRYQKTNGDDPTRDTNKGELQFPDELALLIGGRAGEHMGFLLEFSALSGEAGVGALRVPFTHKVEGTTLSIVPFLGDSAGPGLGFELLNTGILRPQRVGEDRSAYSAAQYVGLGAGSAEGVAFAASNELGFANVTFWAPKFGNFGVKRLAPYLRVAYTPHLSPDWDTAIGVMYQSGKASSNNGGAPVDYVTEGTAVDLQLQGQVGKMPLGVYAVYALAPYDAKNIYNRSGPNAKNAWSLQGQLGVIPNRLSLMLGYRSADTGARTRNRDNATTLGFQYKLVQNAKIEVSHRMLSGNRYSPKPGNGDQLTTLMLMFAY